MNLIERIGDLLDRIAAYNPLAVVVELALIWGVVFAIARFVQGTRAAGALRGILVILILLVMAALALRTLGIGDQFARLTFLSDRMFAVVAIALVVIFQPELRRGLIRLGEAPFFRTTPGEIAETVDAVAQACEYLGRNRFGALIVFERQVGLSGLVEGGTRLDAACSARLLQTIFFPGSALHDLAVVIRGNVVHAASVQLPLAEPEEMPDPALGSRHRAAVGVTGESDALAVVVSEESGNLRIAERGKLGVRLTPDELRRELREKLEVSPPTRARTAGDEEARRITIPDSGSDRPDSGVPVAGKARGETGSAKGESKGSSSRRARRDQGAERR